MSEKTTNKNFHLRNLNSKSTDIPNMWNEFNKVVSVTTADMFGFLSAPELIAVAQATKQYAGLVSECCMTGDRTGEVCDLHCALEALRATGKVEL